MPDIGELREEYLSKGLVKEDLSPNPVDQFRTWFQQAKDAALLEPNAMTLATVDKEGKPWQRTVLLKAFDDKGFIFYTNYNSRKATQIEDNRHVSLLFPWLPLQRQIIINGETERVSTTESLKYFASRPFGSRLGAWVSHQSSVISSRSILEAKLREMKDKFSSGDIPLPSFWGGYRVKPEAFEFWQGSANRLHDRFFYSVAESGSWNIERLSP